MSSLLPKSTVEFSDSQYWEAFFKQRGNKAFEWYGEYPELCGYLHKYIKPKDNILVVGCGNSKLSEGLYDVGYRHITNIDISKVVIRQMKSSNQEIRPELIFEEMDALSMTYEPDAFSVVFDKGTLDALMTDNSKETISTVEQYLKEIDRVLRFGGRYIVVSLLQEHILTYLLDYFTDKGWMIRVCRCHEAEDRSYQELNIKPLPVFMAVFTKFKKIDGMRSVCELSLYSEDKPVRVAGIDEIKEGVLEAQKISMVMSGLQRSSSDGQEIGFEVSRPGEPSPRYSLRVVEKYNSNMKAPKKYAAFVVPQGRECEWIFGTVEGRQFLLKEAGVDRLVVIILNRGHIFSNLDEVKSELSPLVQDFKPSDFKARIEYLSVGEDLGLRNEIYAGESPLSGKYVVEETQQDKILLRRLYFLSSKNAIQSEAKVRKVKTRKGSDRVVVDTSYLACSHHGYMTIGAASVLDVSTEGSLLVIGLGGGGLCSFLRKAFPKSRITAVELDPEILRIASDYFGLVQDKQLMVYIQDGLKFLSEAESRGETFDVLIFDVDNKDVITGLSSPPKEFISSEVLSRVKKLLKPKGVFILNLVSWQKSIRDDLDVSLKSTFGNVKALIMADDLNELFFCWNSPKVDPPNALTKAYSRINDIIKQKKLEPLPCVDISFLKGLLVD